MVQRRDTDSAVLIGDLAVLLGTGAPVRAALELLVDGLALRSAVLRRDAAELLAVAGDVVSAVPAMRQAGGSPDPGRCVELAAGGAVLVVEGARPSQLPALRAAAAVLGLALLAGRAPSLSVGPLVPPLVDEAAALLLEADDDGDLLADALHDGPVQALVAARYACDAALRGGDAGLARDAVQEALVDLRRLLWHLRPRGSQGLADALGELSARLVEARGPALHLVLDADAASALPPAARSVAYRLVQAVARDTAGPVRVGLRAGSGDVLLDVDGGSPLQRPDRWRRRLRALGGDLSSSAGRLRLSLPASSAPETVRSTTPSETKACS